MTPTPQPKALELAEIVRYTRGSLPPETRNACSAELRRQHAEIERLNDRLEFHYERAAQREQRLWQWAHEELSEPLKTRYFNIVANGTADVMEQPVYAQQFNMMKHRAESAESERDSLRAEVERLTRENANLRSVMIAAAEEIHEHWDAHCDSDGYGPANLMRRLEAGIPSEYAYKAGDFARMRAEVERLREDAERLDFITEHRVLVSPEFEGCWDATRYDDEPEPVASFSGATPRAAIDAAREAKG